ncbi:MAG: IS5 family transposase [Saprospiraceae bacterium]|nr:IS5 family transposase [Saprospiraceae bacterium]
MAKSTKTLASKTKYISQHQLKFEGFETPFEQHLDPTNRWIVLAKQLPWDELISIYQDQLRNRDMGSPGLNPRLCIGTIIIKHMCSLSDRETVEQISENMYMQYFLGFTSFTNKKPMDASVLVDIRNRMGIEQIEKINQMIFQLGEKEKDKNDSNPDAPKKDQPAVENEGQLIVDATACPQDISYPTDVKLLHESREKADEIIDVLYAQSSTKKRPRTYREKAQVEYVSIAKRRNNSGKQIRNGIRKQLNYLKRNIQYINKLIDQVGLKTMDQKQYKYWLVIQQVYAQQQDMYEQKKHHVEHRIVSIHQPHVRPIVRGKLNAKVEFGSKINVSLVNGFAFLDDLEWEAYNEGGRLSHSIEKYKKRFGFYPKEVLVDRIYCSRDNRTLLKQKGILLKAKPLGRPSAVQIHVSPGERNPIEGFFGVAKVAYGMQRIKARLQSTSESWIASIIMVVNLVKLAGMTSYSLCSTLPVRITKTFHESLAMLFLYFSDLPKFYSIKT